MPSDSPRFHPRLPYSAWRKVGLPFLFAAALAPAILAAQAPRLRGEWRLDSAHSDSIPERYGRFARRDSADTATPPPVQGSRAEPTEVPYGGGHRYRSPDSNDLARMRQTVELARTPAERLRISPDGKTLTLIDSSGAELTWRIDGRKVSEPLEGGGSVERRVRWNGDALVIERKVNGGGKVTETCRLGLGGDRLLVFVEVTGLFQPLEFRRQYEPAENVSKTAPADSAAD